MQWSNVKRYLSSLLIVIVITIVFIIPVIFLSIPKPEGVWINCGVSEISPDFTTEMREACRQLRATNNLQKPK
jgi:hypothetical protein